MTAIPVHVWLPGEFQPTLAGDFTHDGRVGRFQYAATYLAAKHPPLAPDMPTRAQAHVITRGQAIFPLFLDAGPDTWGQHVLERRLGRAVSPLEALTLCPSDGVGNIALGELTEERQRVLTLDEFLEVLKALEAGKQAQTSIEDQVLAAHNDGTSLGGTKPKLTIERDGVLYLAKFPERGDSQWLPHIECATLRLAAMCGLRTIEEPEVWHLPSGRSALLVKRFDREYVQGGFSRKGYVSAHALLRLDTLPRPEEGLQFATKGFTPQSLRKSYVALSEDMQRWCGGQEAHREERRELWRRIVFNALVRNLDDHARNHGLLCEDMSQQQWRLSPAFDLVPSSTLPKAPALCLAYRFVPGGRRSNGEAQRLAWVIDIDDLLAAATDHYGYEPVEAREYLTFAAGVIAGQWQKLFKSEGVSDSELDRFAMCFEFAAAI